MDGPEGVDIPDRTKDMYGPYGDMRDQTTIQKGKCWTDSAFFNDDDVKQIAKCALDVFDAHTDATFMWTAHNEIEPRWDYLKAFDKGWLTRDSTSTSDLKFVQ